MKSIAFKSLWLGMFLTGMFFWGVAQSTQGDDLIKLLGNRESAPAVAEFSAYAGTGDDKGILLVFEKSKLERIDLFNENSALSQSGAMFKGKLPKGITFDHTIAQCRKILGEGLVEDGDVLNALILSKNFILNENDAYQIIIEFKTGVMDYLSLIYVQDGTGGFTQSGKVNKAKVGGDDFLYMVKKNKYNKLFTDLVQGLGKADFKGGQQWVYKGKGIQIDFDGKKLVKNIDLYAGNSGGFQRFELPLPYGLRFTDKRDDVIRKAGQPVRNEGGAMVYEADIALMSVYFQGSTISKVSVSVNPDVKTLSPEERRKNYEAQMEEIERKKAAAKKAQKEAAKQTSQSEKP